MGIFSTLKFIELSIEHAAGSVLDEVKTIELSIVVSGGGGGGESVTTIEHVSDVEGLAVYKGKSLPVGSNIDDLATYLLNKTYNPTITQPLVNVNKLGINYEVGAITTFVFAINFNRGTILGALVGGVWDENASQGNTAGAATDYTVNGVSRGTNDSPTYTHTVVDGVNTIHYSVSYAQGTQPLNSKNENFGSPLAAGTISKTETFNSLRKMFYGGDQVTGAAYTTSAQVRAMESNYLNPQNGTVINIAVNTGDKKISFAYPATLRDATSVKYVELSNMEILGNFEKTTVTVEGANGASPIAYKLYTFTPAVPFTQNATYQLTI